MGRYDQNLFVDRERELQRFGNLLKPETPWAVWLIEAGEYMGKSWLLHRMDSRCGEGAEQPPDGQICPIPVVKIDFEEREQHEIQDSLSLIRFIRDGLGQPGYFYHLNDMINWFTEGRSAALTRALEVLVRQVEQHVDFDGLRRLSRILGIRYENLPGGEAGTLYEKTHGLVVEVERRRKLPEFFDELEALYRDLDWSHEEETVLMALSRAQQGEPAEEGRPVEDFDAPLPADAGQSQAESEISKAFFAALQKLERELKPIVLLFDSYDKAPPEVRGWIQGPLLKHLGPGMLEEVVVIIAGRPDGIDFDPEGKEEIVVPTGLGPFGEDDIRAYLQVRKIPFEPAEIPFYRRKSGGKPGVLALMADGELASQQKDDPRLQ